MKTWIYKEWLLIRRRRSSWLILAAFALLFYFSNRPWAEQFEILDQQGGVGLAPYRFPEIWSTLGYVGSWMVYFPCLLVIGNVTADFRHRTYRQQKIHGWTDLDFLGSKFLLALGLSLFALIVFLFTGTMLGQGQQPVLSIAMLTDSLGFSLLYLNFLCFSLLLAVWLRHSLAAFTLLIVFDLFLENLLSLVVPSIGRPIWLPLASSESLFPNPLFRPLMTSLKEAEPTFAGLAYLSSLLWIGIYLLVSYRLLQRGDA